VVLVGGIAMLVTRAPTSSWRPRPPPMPAERSRRCGSLL